VPKIKASTVAEHRARQQAAILTATRELLAEGGAEVPSLAEVAQRAGLARPSIYQYYSSREELLDAVIADMFPRWSAYVTGRMGRAGGPGARALTYVDANLRLVARGDQAIVSGLAQAGRAEAMAEPRRVLHEQLRVPLVAALAEHGATDPEGMAELVQAVVYAASRMIESGTSERKARALARTLLTPYLSDADDVPGCRRTEQPAVCGEPGRGRSGRWVWDRAVVDLPRPDIDPGGLIEYSVVFTDRSLNHMSQRFVRVMQDAVDVLRTTYAAETVAVVPGGGTYAMEAVARQLATGRRCLVLRDGYFSYRWTQIFEAGSIPSESTVCAARPIAEGRQAAWAPPPVDEVVATIGQQRPELVLAAHVETAAGIVLPDDYVRAVAAATHEVGGLMVLDCIASGASWVDMTSLGVDVLLSAPQKGWSGSPCAGFVMLGEAGRTAVESTTSTSFAVDLRRWLAITEAYQRGETPYHATLPTDSLAHDAELMVATRDRGLDRLRAAQIDLGEQVRALLAGRGFPSVAAEGFAAASVVVAHTDDPDIRSGAKFKDAGLQIAAGVPLMCGEREDFSTFRIGLFGLDKLDDVAGTVARLEASLDRLRG
jgi:aspartate aminotransferase-like enzyme/AcrR family transcriptional regulator